jgi:hypothetical protein
MFGSGVRLGRLLSSTTLLAGRAQPALQPACCGFDATLLGTGQPAPSTPHPPAATSATNPPSQHPGTSSLSTSCWRPRAFASQTSPPLRAKPDMPSCLQQLQQRQGRWRRLQAGWRLQPRSPAARAGSVGWSCCTTAPAVWPSNMRHWNCSKHRQRASSSTWWGGAGAGVSLGQALQLELGFWTACLHNRTVRVARYHSACPYPASVLTPACLPLAPVLCR